MVNRAFIYSIILFMITACSENNRTSSNNFAENKKSNQSELNDNNKQEKLSQEVEDNLKLKCLNAIRFEEQGTEDSLLKAKIIYTNIRKEHPNWLARSIEARLRYVSNNLKQMQKTKNTK